MLQKYNDEYYKLKDELESIEAMVESYETNNDNSLKFIQLVEKYATFEDISQTMLNEFISKIVVHEREDKGNLNSPQRIEFHFNYIGKFNNHQPKLSDENMARIEADKLYRQHRRKIQRRYREKKKLLETIV